MLTDILLIGAGGQGKVVCASFRLQHPKVRIRLVDESPRLHGREVLGISVEPMPRQWDAWPSAVHVCIGDNAARKKVSAELLAAGKELVSIFHPAACISEYAVCEPGVFIAAGAVVGPNCKVGAGVIVNHGAVVDHDCNIGAFAHIAPNATLGGGETVGEGVLVGAGSVVLPGLEIGEWATVGGGAVVTRPVIAHDVVLGVPARSQK